MAELLTNFNNINMIVLKNYQISEMVENLRLMLPLSVQMYWLGKNSLRGKCPELMFIADTWPGFSTILVRPIELKNVTTDRSEDIYIYSTDVIALKNLLLISDILPWNEILSFATLRSHDISPAVQKILCQKGQIKIEKFHVMYQVPSLCKLNKPDPPGYSFGPVFPKHVAEMNSLWIDGKTEKSKTFLHKLIERFPFIRVYTVDDDLVGFSGMNLDGSCDIGYVKPEHHGYNLFAYLAAKQAILLKDEECLFGFVALKNQAAYINLCKAGFVSSPEMDCEWITYTPTKNCTNIFYPKL